MTDDEQMLEREFWEALEESPFIMLGLQGVDNSFTRPMTAQVDDGRIWFFANRSDDLVQGLQRTDRAVATYSSRNHDLFASIHGRLELRNDREAIDRLWSPSVASWFKGGKDDADLALIRFDTESADIWKAESGSTLKAAVIKMFGRDPGEQQQEKKRAEVAL